ncbi:MAG: hypothetical protein IPL12_02125 [Bacteroidetes bacterium]|nr:hypothetical protein [Bacteroidota bacterium]
MISKETIGRIMDASRIEEVVGDFVNLKRRGVNLIGKCPFHNERRLVYCLHCPRIYKCFGCGKSGNSVGFVMGMQQLSYRRR